ncbi:YihY/virulence factor BrkB family protein [Rhodobacteraceae bacterium F11138]|nr:YihY/virulence factor BrkB family protein [Rhodobacteraceae bacterium F11138]
MYGASIVRFLRAFLGACNRFNEKGGWVMSSHIAMSMMMALFPFVLFVVALAATLSQDIDVDNLIELVFGSWPDEIAQPITREVRKVLTSDHSSLLTLGGVLAIYFASNGVDAVRQAMTRAYRDEDPRPYWRKRLLCLAFVVFGGAIILTAAALGVALPLYMRFVTDAVPIQIPSWLGSEVFNSVSALCMLSAGVAACHYWLPGDRHPLKQILPGVLLTVLLWVLAATGFSYYLARFASYSATYAGLAGVMVALIFLYLMGAILILGAEFNGALMKRAGLQAQ